jgi:NADH-quinone oxidoreductase subunit J
MGVSVAVLTFGSLAAGVLASHVVPAASNPKPLVLADVAVSRIGEKLMTDYVVPLEVVALLLTAALIGAVIIAMHEEPK